MDRAPRWQSPLAMSRASVLLFLALGGPQVVSGIPDLDTQLEIVKVYDLTRLMRLDLVDAVVDMTPLDSPHAVRASASRKLYMSCTLALTGS